MSNMKSVSVVLQSVWQAKTFDLLAWSMTLTMTCLH